MATPLRGKSSRFDLFSSAPSPPSPARPPTASPALSGAPPGLVYEEEGCEEGGLGVREGGGVQQHQHHRHSRGKEFVLDPQRLNVALSRAQCLAVVVGSPSLASVTGLQLPDTRNTGSILTQEQNHTHTYSSSHGRSQYTHHNRDQSPSQPQCPRPDDGWAPDSFSFSSASSASSTLRHLKLVNFYCKIVEEKRGK